MENPPRRVEEDDPHRCQAVRHNGNQCINEAVQFEDGSYGKNCIVHGGASQLESEQKNKLRNYNLTKFRARIYDKANSEHIKSLRDEIGILRMVLETHINRCTDDTSLLLESHKISDMIDKISKLVTACHKIEGAMGQLLDKQMILQFAAEVVEIVGNNIADKILLEKISNGIMGIIGRLGDEE